MNKRVCLLTGASGVLGTAFCRSFASRYAIAAVYRRNPPKVPSQFLRLIDPLDAQLDVDENKHPVFAIRADLSDPLEHGRVIEFALAHFSRIDLVVHAAAASLWDGLVRSDKVLHSFQNQFNVNAFAPLNISTMLIRRSWMHSRAENTAANRHIVTISSTAADTLYKSRGQSVYAASKAALNTLTKHMAEEFGQFNVRVNGIAPDTFRSGDPELTKVLDAIAHLDSVSTTGEILSLR